MDIIKETKLIGNYLISLRKDFHKHPELGMEEYRTSKRIKEELDKIGVKYEDGIKTEVVATIGSGEEKVIALRAYPEYRRGCAEEPAGSAHAEC